MNDCQTSIIFGILMILFKILWGRLEFAVEIWVDDLNEGCIDHRVFPNSWRVERRIRQMKMDNNTLEWMQWMDEWNGCSFDTEGRVEKKFRPEKSNCCCCCYCWKKRSRSGAEAEQMWNESDHPHPIGDNNIRPEAQHSSTCATIMISCWCSSV